MSNPGYRIFTNVARPAKELMELFRDIPVPNIDDQMGRIYCVDSGIRPLNTTPLLGCAITVKAPSGDNLMFHKALEMAQEGDIIVVSGIGGGERSFSGEIMAHYAMYKKLGGFVVDGFVRDLEGCKDLPFPIYARGIEPNGPYKNGPGEINVPVAIGSQVVFPGDILVGDQDGLIVIRPKDAEQVALKARKLLDSENVKKEGLDSGVNTLDRTWMDKVISQGNYTID